MCSQVMPVFFKSPDQSLKSGIPVKIARQKEGGFGLVLLQHQAYDFPSVSKRIAGKDQRDLPGRCIAPDDRPVAVYNYFFA